MPSILKLFLLCGLLAACNNVPGGEASYSEAELQAQEQAYQQMMEAHDRIMPRMGEMNQASRALRARLDSPDLADAERQEINTLLQDLERAEDGMMEWMSSLRPLDSLRERNDHGSVMEYLEQETADIQQVEEEMRSVLERAGEKVE